MQQATVWVVDDDDAIRWVLDKALSNAGLRCATFSAGAQVLAALAKEAPDVLLSDIRMPDIDGLALLTEIKQRQPLLPVIIMTAHSDLQSAVSAYQHGAFDYLPKPFDIDDALTLAERAIAHHQEQKNLQRHPASSSDSTRSVPQPPAPAHHSPAHHLPAAAQASGQCPSSPSASDGIIGEAPAMQEVFRIIGRLSSSSINVLINGESGTGKELVAHALHQHSPRAAACFIPLNMAAIPKELIESELFGHEKGAFTGASQIRQGRFEQSDGGTLFLDEIGDMPLEVQTRLLRVLADGQFYRVGGRAPVRVNVRIIAATHQNLERRVREGAFREDLYHRLNVIRIQLPPLRERPEDIPQLARHFLHTAACELAVEPKHLQADAQAALMRFSWPGNVRQLENTCRWLTVMAAGNDVLLQDLPAELRDATASIAPLPASASAGKYATKRGPAEKTAAEKGTVSTDWCELLAHWADQALTEGRRDLLSLAQAEMERVLLDSALRHTGGHKQQAAHRLGLGRNTLARKLKQRGVQ